MECSICFNLYSHLNYIPLIFPCGHTFCQLCVTNLTQNNSPNNPGNNSGNNKFKCPNCNIIHYFDSINQLPRNYTLLSLLDEEDMEIIEIKEEKNDNEEKKENLIDNEIDKNIQNNKNFCEGCQNKHIGTHKCIECDEIMCSKLANSHKKFKLTKDHRVMLIEDANKFLNSHPHVIKCLQHPTEFLKYFDETCTVLLCPSCAIFGNHIGHKFISIDEAIIKYQANYQEILNEMTLQTKKLNEAEDNTNSLMISLTESYEEKKNQIDNTFQELIALLDNRRQVLQNSLDQEYNSLTQTLLTHYGSLNKLKQSINKVTSSCGDVAELKTNDFLQEFIHLKGHYQEHYSLYKSTLHSTTVSNELVETLSYQGNQSLEFISSSNLQNLISEFGFIRSIGGEKLTTLSLQTKFSLNFTTYGENMTINVSVSDSNNSNLSPEKDSSSKFITVHIITSLTKIELDHKQLNLTTNWNYFTNEFEITFLSPNESFEVHYFVYDKSINNNVIKINVLPIEELCLNLFIESRCGKLEAFKRLELLTKQGNPVSIGYFALLIHKSNIPLIIPHDINRAISLAEQIIPYFNDKILNNVQLSNHEEYIIGTFYNESVGFQQNYSIGYEYLENSAKSGNCLAQNSLGVRYYSGKDVPKDINKSLYWYNESAKLNYPIAQYNLANRYCGGFGVDLDHDEAVRLYKLAADRGFSDAQHSLGYCYDNGIGVEKDVNEAVKWYLLAASQGHEQSKQVCDRLKLTF